MPLSADTILDRIKLKSQINKWRSLSIVAVTLLLLSLVFKNDNIPTNPINDYIARVSIEGIILEDRERDQKIESLAKDSKVKAAIIYINSPGGTMVGGETLYDAIRKLSNSKPVVAVMGSVAASGGYMAAIAADRIYARAGTITGSVGVMMQSAEITELSKKVGVNFLTFRSGDMKGSPSPFEKLDEETKKIIDENIKDSFTFFINMVKERRKLNNKDLSIISDGRIFTGRQAVSVNLVDDIGGEDAAKLWLDENYNINSSTPVKDVKLRQEKIWLERVYSKITGPDFLSGSGMMAFWQTSQM